jgi:hypothetical protein
MSFRLMEVRIRPIQSWPGEETQTRKHSPFRATYGTTLAELDVELRALKAKNVVLQLAVRDSDVRLDGGLKSGRRPADPRVILSMDTPHGPLSYPCDTFRDWTDNLRAVVLALNALRAVDRYGVTKHGEQYTGWKQLPGGTPMPAATMTVDQAAAFLAEATGEPCDAGDFLDSPGVVHGPSVERGYRVAVKRLHPDAGGSTEDFQRLQQAKRVLDGGVQ